MLNQTFPWLTTLIVVPAVGALVLWFLPRGLRAHARRIALGFSLVTLALAVAAATTFDTARAGVHQLVEQAAWIPQIGVSWALGVDGVGLALVLMALVLVPVVILAAWKEHPDGGAGEAIEGGDRNRRYLALVLVLTAFMVAIFAARDLFLFYVVFEAMLVPVYFMIGQFGGPQRRYAAVKFLLFSLAGGLIMLVGVIALYFQGPGGEQGFLLANLTGLSMDPTVERLLFASFFLAFAVKAPLWPVHTWLPDAAEQAPAGTSTLLVGVLDKVGTFGMLTLCLPLFPAASAWAAPGVIVLAVISVLYGALLAIGQQNLLRLVAYTSVSHFGFMVLGIFALTSTGIAGASFYMVNHGLSTGALFLLAGFLVARRGSARLEDFGGLQKIAPVLAGTFLVAGLSALSLPGLSTFVSEYLVVVGSFTTWPVATVIATLGVILAALYVLIAYQKIFTGPAGEGMVAVPDLSGREKWVVGPLVALLVVLGLYPAPALGLVSAPADVTLQQVGVSDPEPTLLGAPGTSIDGSEQ